MKRVIYSKASSYRKPEYRIRTSIIEEYGIRFVEKTALCDKAISHIDTMRSNYELIKDIYNDIKVVPFEDVDRDTIRFPFIEGKPMTNDISFCNDTEDELMSKLSDIFGKILDFRADIIVPFAMTEGFSRMFPGCEPKEGIESVRIANLDSIFSNFVDTPDGIYLFDYEWVVDFPVPIEYLKFRNMLYEIKALSPNLSYFNDESEEFKMLTDMDENFQFMVHGQNRENMYDRRYLKEHIDVEYRLSVLGDESKIYHRMMEDSLFGFYEVLQSLKRRITKK